MDDEYDGIIDKTEWEYASNLSGNQFVWIPCNRSEYVKKDWGKQSSGWDKTTPDEEYIQIDRYGGFYVARYEAGLASTISEFTTQQENTGTVFNLDGIPQSKSGIISWSFISWQKANSNAQKMYENNEYVSSGLVTGTQWDVMLNTVINKTDLVESDVLNSSKWGNYKNTKVYYVGRLSKMISN